MSKARVMIVEDEQIIAMDIQNILERNGFSVVGHTDQGDDAIKKAGELRPDLIMMDIGLKGDIDGIEAATQIWKRFSLPVIFLTAFATQATIERAKLAEPYGYLLKPFDEHELRIAIEMGLYKHSMEQKLQESEKRFRGVIEHATDGIVLFDSQGFVVEWNLAMEQITDLKRSDAVGRTIWEIALQLMPQGKKATAERSEAFTEEFIAEVKSFEIDKKQLMEYEVESLQGVRRMVQSNGFSVDTAQGKLSGLIMRDITERKILENAERDQRQLAEALRDTAMTLNSTLKLDDVLDRILDNIGTLVQYDAAMVSLIEGEAVRKIRHKANPQNTTNQKPIGDMQANLLNVPILNTLVQTRQPYLIPDIQNDKRWQIVAIPGMQRIRSLICVPIEIQGIVAGVINIVSTTPDFFTPVHTERIMMFAGQAAVAIENAKLYEQAKHLSITDSLTGLFNMRYFLDFALLEFERVRRYSRTLSVAMMDIDHFKNINDAHGHSTGDFVLREIAQRIKHTVRAVDVVARYGGEEFVILMPETGIESAAQMAERIRLAVENNSIASADACILVTVSLGIAEVDEGTKDFESLLRNADQALYAAKAEGRNRVFAWQAGK